MTGKARYIAPRKIPDSRFQEFTSNESSAANRVTTSTQHFTRSQFVSSLRGLFSGAFGNLESSLNISTGVLNITNDGSGSIRIRRVVHINPESGTSDILDAIETEGAELPYQELKMIGVPGDTLTITHDFGSATGTQRPILCPNGVDYTLSGAGIVSMIFDTSISKWVIHSDSGGGDITFPVTTTVKEITS